jgi:hypothetical protein
VAHDGNMPSHREELSGDGRPMDLTKISVDLRETAERILAKVAASLFKPVEIQPMDGWRFGW